MSCSNIKNRVTIRCGDIRPMSLEERRQLLERQTWISNVIRILHLPQWEAEYLWVKIQTENHNSNL